MTPERWQQADELLQAVLEQQPEAHRAFLVAACAGDAELQQEVETLLQYQQQLGGFMNAPPVAAMAEVFASGQHERAGQTISHYQIMRAIGHGGMGEVYLARDTQLGRQVALKLLPPRFTADLHRVQRFRQEARAASALNHPNIITIHEIGEEVTESGSAHFIATEFIEGRTLRELIREGGMKLGEALEVAIQTAGALAAAHQAGITHRDIKPENIMLRPDGYVKVLDFGLAKLNERPATAMTARFAEVETDPGMVLGTVSYMSPEQARGLETDGQSDVFSLGVVLYEMITARLPFEGATPIDVIASLIGQEPPPLTRYAPDLPAELQRLISRALAKDCAGRFQTADELRRALKKLKQDLTPAGDFTTREFSDLSLLARRFGNAGEGDDFKTRMGTARAPARTTSSISLLISRLIRSPLRVAVALATLAVFITGVVFGWQWLNRSSGPGNSIAVLPFANAVTDPQMEYLPDGITESLIRSLSQLPGLRVMARSTVFTYKGHETDPRQVGAALKVRAVVTGRVEQRGNRLIVEVELADASDGALLWSEQYQHPLADLLAVQEKMAGKISEKLRLRLSGEQQQQLAKRHTANSDAYQLYLKGHYFHYQFTRESLEKAIDYFQQATNLDPNYALPHAEMAEIYADMSAQYLTPSEAMPKAKQAAEQALAADGTLAEAHNALAMVKWLGDWDWRGAEREFQRALELNPNFAHALVYYTHFLIREGRFEEALREAQRAIQLDPLSPFVEQELTIALYFARQYDRAIEECRKTLELNPGGVSASWVHGILGNVFVQRRMYPEAIAEARQSLAINRTDAGLSWLGFAYAMAGQKHEARQILQELEGQAAQRRVSPIYIARIYIGLGDKDRALEWLRKGYDEHSDHVLNLAVEPIYDGLRSDPRFIEMLRGIGLAQ